MARLSIAAMLSIVQASNAALKAVLQVESSVENLETVAAQQNPLGFLLAFMSIIHTFIETATLLHYFFGIE